MSFVGVDEIWVSGSQVATGFGSTFGFYIETPQSNVFFTEDSLNNGEAQALIYQGDGTTTLKIAPHGEFTFTTDKFILAFEDLDVYAGLSDEDYNDFVLLVDGLQPVPEPHAMVLFAAGVLVVGAHLRRESRSRE